MNNVCECKEEIELSTKGGQLTLMELYTRLNKLELENGILKANNYELKKQNLQLRSDINVLHNRLNVGSYDKTLFEGNNPDNGYDEEELANAYAMAENDFKFGGHDMKINE